MNKRGFVHVVQAIVILVVLGVSVTVFANLASEESQRFLGLTNYSMTEEVEEFEEAEALAKVPSDSMKGLTYAINALAYTAYWDKWADIGKTAGEFLESDTGEEIYQENRKAFGQTKVSTIPFGLKRLRLGVASMFHARDDPVQIDQDKEDMYMRFTLALLDCWSRFKDSGYDNVYCFDTSYYAGDGWGPINEENFTEWYDDHNSYFGTKRDGDDSVAQNISAYFNKDSSVKEDKEAINEYVGMLNGIFGVDTFLGIFASDLDFDTKDENLVDGENYVICGTHDNLDVDREIWIVPISNWEKCDVDEEDTLGNQKYSYFVKDFELPQPMEDILDNPNRSEDGYIEANADPAYVIYYEAFPEGEDEIWRIKGTDEYWSSIKRAVFLSVVADLTFGAGKVLLAIKPIKVVFDVATAPVRAAARGFSSLAKAVFMRATGKGPGRMATELLEASVQATVRGNKAWGRVFGDKLGTKVEAEIAEDLSEGIASYFGKEAIDKTTGRLTKEGAEKLRRELTEDLEGEVFQIWERTLREKGDQLYGREGVEEFCD